MCFFFGGGSGLWFGVLCVMMECFLQGNSSDAGAFLAWRVS